jgi:hypothetical protein
VKEQRETVTLLSVYRCVCLEHPKSIKPVLNVLIRHPKVVEYLSHERELVDIAEKFELFFVRLVGVE